ncbi:hypothetical protein DWY73_06060 [Bacteroides fragilis]|uniref:Uncharacterized protein n=1 Tax=Bacteroides fragilis (strain ATCC 25285 / DSM 2151 / CCUG 4856 / JCM 11019 / LMG 10263 / NCTC 9343 / Onslow / VPI 2553 / EN-2) TaxID=272559 RepID=Q5LEX1_BACFN|nr:hypothetical protein HMPREF0101_00572 [Bacteroides fragilis]CAH07328.1 hypothetical protein BF9343_1547 [Bacteroides fragilis NCTC 9343]KAB7795467.1 hypothetical protein E5C01_05605 [Bacteroides fragilis]OOD23822.1 hypothetical protein BWP07_15925 [Bacteroides fragilis]QCT78139.1 hypothetical protein E0L14_12335 [Bacteroides fragilis]
MFKSETICHIYRLKCDGFSYFVYKKRTYSKKNRFNPISFELKIQSIKWKQSMPGTPINTAM